MKDLLYEIIEYIKKLFISIFGVYHVEEGSTFLEQIDISLFDRIIFIVISITLILSIWLPKIIHTEKKHYKLIVEIIIHIIIVGTIIYETIHGHTYLKGGILLLIYILYEMSKEIFLTKNEKNEKVKSD